VKATNSKNNIVIFKLGSLGDTIVALPFFHRIAERFPDSRRILLTNFPETASASPLEAILEGTGLIHEYISYPTRVRSPAILWALRQKLAALKADTLIYLLQGRSLFRSRRDYLFFRLCGFSNIIGTPFTAELCTGKIDPQTGFVERECERMARCLEALGPIDLHAREGWDLHLTERERQTGRAAVLPAVNGRYIAINMGGKVVENDWGSDNWLALIDKLAVRYRNYGLVAVGAAQDAERATRVGAHWPGSFANLCGRLTPRESAAALEGAVVFIGHDSGPLHMASAVGVHCVGIYGGNNLPMKWHPIYGDHKIIHKMAGVLHIKVDEVMQAVESILKNLT